MTLNIGRIIHRNGEYEEGKFTWNTETYSFDLQKGFKYNILNRGSQYVKIGTFKYHSDWQEHDMIQGIIKWGIVPENCIKEKDFIEGWEADQTEEGIYKTGSPSEESMNKYLIEGIRKWKGGDKYEGTFRYAGEGKETVFAEGTVQFLCFVFCLSC